MRCRRRSKAVWRWVTGRGALGEAPAYGVSTVSNYRWMMTQSIAPGRVVCIEIDRNMPNAITLRASKRREIPARRAFCCKTAQFQRLINQ